MTDNLIDRIHNRVDMKAQLIDAICETSEDKEHIRLKIITTFAEVEGDLCRTDCSNEFSEIIKAMDNNLNSYPVGSELVNGSKMVFLKNVEIKPFASGESVSVRRSTLALFTDSIVGISIG